MANPDIPYESTIANSNRDLRTTTKEFASIPYGVFAIAIFLVLLSLFACVVNKFIAIEMANEFSSHQFPTDRARLLESLSAFNNGLMMFAIALPAMFFSWAPLTPRNCSVIALSLAIIVAGCLWLGNSLQTDIGIAVVHKPEFVFLLPSLFFGLSLGPCVAAWLFRWNIRWSNFGDSRNVRDFGLAYVIFTVLMIALTTLTTIFHGYPGSMVTLIALLFSAILGVFFTSMFRQILRGRKPLIWTIVFPLIFSFLCFVWFETTDGYPGVAQWNALLTFTMFATISVAFVLMRFAGVRIDNNANKTTERLTSRDD